MAKILIVYWSTTWNTQTVAEEIEGKLLDLWNEVNILSWSEISADKIIDYDFTFIWSSTWWDWDVQDDMVDFVEDILINDLTWKSVAVFATWMSSFPHFCKAWDTITNALKESNAEIKAKIFRIDWDIDNELENVWDWAVDAIKFL